MVLRELGSPVPSQTCCVSDGAIAKAPVAATGYESNTGRNVTPPLVVFQMPPAAAATKNVFDGLGIAAMSEVRPSKFAGPTVRQRSPAMVAESSGGRAACANAVGPARTLAARMGKIEIGRMKGGGRETAASWAASTQWSARSAIGPEQAAILYAAA